MQLPNTAMAAAFGRHVITAASSVVATLAILHIMSPDQASAANDAVGQISDGVAKIAAGVGALIPVVSGVYAALTASPLWQLFAVSRNPAVHQVIADAPVAQKVPSDKVVAPQ